MTRGFERLEALLRLWRQGEVMLPAFFRDWDPVARRWMLYAHVRGRDGADLGMVDVKAWQAARGRP